MKKILSSLITLSSTSPPTEFRIWGYGEIVTTKGTFLLDQDGAASVLAAAADYGNRLGFDYNHASVLEAGDTPSAGTFELEIRTDGLWAVNCQWTVNASSRLSAKEYLYFSPTFYVDGDNRVIELMNIALTNLPATKNMEPLVASRLNRRQVQAAMAFDDIYSKLGEAIEEAYGYAPYLSEVFDEYVVFRSDGVTYAVGYAIDGTELSLVGEPREVTKQYQDVPGGKTMNKALLLSLRLAESATEAEAVLAAKNLSDRQNEIVTLTGAANITEALGVLHAWKEQAGRAVEAERKLASITGERESEQRAALLEQAQKEGKISPAQVDFWRGQPLETLSGFLKAASPIVPTGQHNADEATKPVHLSEQATNIAKLLGVKPEDMAARAAQRGN
ncbi:phage protease [Deinococcus radiomollis]|uniref:phage protease n=1 Tax=Deinococcus radiomollis TaxID=468916 RepID=UPI003891350C